jgi:alpha-L-rhamnosidase
VSRWLHRRNRYLLDSGFHWGEWLRPGETFPGNILDGTLAEKVREAWQAAFLRPDGRIGTDQQDDYVRALAFDLLPPARRPAVVARLVELIEQADDHLGTGFLSTPMLLPVLADVAYRLLLQTSSPSWLHQIEHDATTIWETWDGGDASRNHYAFGAVAGFLREHVLGISAAEPGYRRIRIAPIIGGGLTHAEGTVETPYGPVASAWNIDGDVGRFHADVPTGTRAEIRLPDATVHDVGSGRHTFTFTM